MSVKIFFRARILFRGGVLFAAILLMTGCLPSADRRKQVLDDLQAIRRTASGSFHAVKTGVGEGIEQGKAVIDDVGQRIDKAQEGIGKMQEGKDLLKEAVGSRSSATQE